MLPPWFYFSTLSKSHVGTALPPVHLCYPHKNTYKAANWSVSVLVFQASRVRTILCWAQCLTPISTATSNHTQDSSLIPRHDAKVLFSINKRNRNKKIIYGDSHVTLHTITVYDATLLVLVPFYSTQLSLWLSKCFQKKIQVKICRVRWLWSSVVAISTISTCQYRSRY